MHKHYNIIPDIAVFGKSLGNGFAITAVIGKKKIMSSSKNSFISSTFWSERVGYVAALETLNQMEKIKSWNKISNLENILEKKLKQTALKNDIEIEIRGLLGIPIFSIKQDKNNIYKTYITQEMLKRGIIINNSVYIKIAHNKKNLNKFFKYLDEIFKEIKKCKTLNAIAKKLDDKKSTSGFGRLNYKYDS